MHSSQKDKKLNTIKTIIGFLISLLRKYTPLKLSKDTLEGIYNFLPISDTITTSGQPTETQFRVIKNAGFQSVINLAPHDAENSLANESSLLNELGLKYIHIPVDFKKPTDKDFKEFVQSMEHSSTEKTWVHCAANMRVSAFMFRYRVDILREDKAKARSDLEKIWKPIGVWGRFIKGT